MRLTLAQGLRLDGKPDTYGLIAAALKQLNAGGA